MEWWETFKERFLGLGSKYHLNPYIFGGIYIGAVPFFLLFLGWTIKNMKNKKSFVLPLLLTALFFISAYLYLILAGKNIPMWLYFYWSDDCVSNLFNCKKNKKKSGGIQ